MRFAHGIMRAGHWGIGLIIVSALLTMVALGDDWTQWRGPSRNGVWNEPGLAETFPQNGLQVIWQRSVGAGWASPVIAQGRIYLFDAEFHPPKARERITCCEEATGKILWAHAYDVNYPEAALKPGQENGPTATPIVHGGKLMTLGQMGDVFCLDAATGAVIWQRNLIVDHQLKGFGLNASPLIEDDLLILVIGGKPDACVLALNKDTGKEVWRALDEASTNSSPIVITAAGRRQLIVWTQQSISALDPLTGKLLCNERLLTSSDNAVSTPVSDGDLLLVGGLMFRLDAGKPGATVLWPDTRAVSHRVLSNTSTAVLHEGHVFSAKSPGAFVCLEAATGRQLWTTDQVTAAKQGSAIHVTLAGGSALLYNDQGELIHAELTPQGYREKSRAFLLAPDQPFGGKKVNWSAPSYANGRVFVRNQKQLVCAALVGP